MQGRRTAESALLESEERYRAVIDSLEEGIILLAADGTITSCNASACRILGLPAEQMLGRGPRDPAWRAVREDGTPFEPESHPAAITLLTGQPCSQVIMGVERPDGTRAWISINSRPLYRAGQDEPAEVAVSFVDITRHKAGREELRRRALQQTALAALGRYALEGTEIEVLMDEAVRRVSSVLEVELCKVVDGMADAGGPSGLRLRASIGWTAGEDGTLRPARINRGDGREWLNGIAAPIFGREGPWGVLSAATRASRDFHREDMEFLQAVANILGVSREQEELRWKIRRSSSEWRITFDAITDPVLLVELDGRIIRLNEAARELAGLSFAQVLHRTAGTIRDAEPWWTITALLRQVEAGVEQPSAQARDEEGRTWDVSLSPVLSPDNQRGAVVVAREITDLVRLQESLRRSETMSAMGALVAGVAHEVRNPLFGISATLDAFASRFKRRTEYRRYVDVLQGEVSRLSELMQQLLDYGKPLRLVLSPESADDVMRAAVAACVPLAERSGVEIVQAAASGLPRLPVDRNRILQVLQNLLENAVQHSPRGGRVWFRAEPAPGEPEGVRFVVEDTGPGFHGEDLPHIFEPFFTRRRGGTGLGLSIVQRIVEQHQGRITAANRPEQGAVVTVTLPLVPKALPEWERVV